MSILIFLLMFVRSMEIVCWYMSLYNEKYRAHPQRNYHFKITIELSFGYMPVQDFF